MTNSRRCAEALDRALRRIPASACNRGPHLSAVTHPRAGFEAGIVGMLRALAEYADEHYNRYTDPPDLRAKFGDVLPGAVGPGDGGPDGGAVLELERPYGIGSDYVLGDAWLEGLAAVRVLLNGELGRLDGGAVDGACIELARAAGFTEEECDGLERRRRA